MADLATINGASGQSRTDDQRFTKLPYIRQHYYFTYEIVLICSLRRYRFVRRTPTSDNTFRSVYQRIISNFLALV